jgi:hypothetical protein
MRWAMGAHAIKRETRMAGRSPRPKETFDIEPSELKARMPETAKHPYIAPSREGRMHLSVWLPGEYKMRLRTIQAMHPDLSLQSLYAEALNDLFVKHGLPVVTE